MGKRLSAEVFVLPELDIPTFHGTEERIRLTRLYGLPNSYPEPDESLFGRCRVLFVDDFRDGKPVAYWSPKERRSDEDRKADLAARAAAWKRGS